ncbi:hypothetical protein MTBBW1_2710006 [Desulfamplus magnetovallimortis]|uniref:DUF3592 domain-containing protein n=1 Tax=Desulfamplus magnetovallimortis TaxID=1246637 RepID=A0A1W1HF54_9BACT|nr:hypothetical protein MTBBW1_2710006 [Desulfamplus magnetovallimortis]
MIESRYVTRNLRRKDKITVVYDPDDPYENFVLEGRISLSYTVFFSMITSVIYFASMCLHYPDFRQYVFDKFK